MSRYPMSRHVMTNRRSGSTSPGASAPAGGRTDVVDVASGAPGPGAVREEVPVRVAVDGLARGLAEDGDDLPRPRDPDQLAAACRGAAQGQPATSGDPALVQPRVVLAVPVPVPVAVRRFAA